MSICIPRIMSFFWSGPMSWMRYMTLHSFRKLNPDWEIRLYQFNATGQRQWQTGEALDSQDYTGEDYFRHVSDLGVKLIEWKFPPRDNLSPIHAADIFRWDYLNTIGGWYSDMDVLWVRPMEELYQKTKDYDVLGCETWSVIGVGMLAGSPNNLWRELYRTAVTGYNSQRYQSTGVEAIARYLGYQDVMPRWEDALVGLREKHPDLTVGVLSHSVGCPYDFMHTDSIFESVETVPEDCVCIHFFGGHPKVIPWNNRLTEKTCFEIDNTFTKYARRVM